MSLCPGCNREAVEAVIRGQAQVADFRDNPGIIEAEILEGCGRILMRKACEKHGPFVYVLPNRPISCEDKTIQLAGEFDCGGNRDLHNHRSNSIRYVHAFENEAEELQFNERSP